MRDYIIAALAVFGVLTVQDALPSHWGAFAGKAALGVLVFLTVLGRRAKP